MRTKVSLWIFEINYNQIDRSGTEVTWIIPGWSLVLFPGHGVPSCITHPSSGIFWALATSPLTRILNSSYSLCSESAQRNIKRAFHKKRKLHFYTYSRTPPSLLYDLWQMMVELYLSSSQPSEQNTILEPWAQCYISCRKEPISLQILTFQTELQMLTELPHRQRHSTRPCQLGSQQQEWIRQYWP